LSLRRHDPVPVASALRTVTSCTRPHGRSREEIPLSRRRVVEGFPGAFVFQPLGALQPMCKRRACETSRHAFEGARRREDHGRCRLPHGADDLARCPSLVLEVVHLNRPGFDAHFDSANPGAVHPWGRRSRTRRPQGGQASVPSSRGSEAPPRSSHSARPVRKKRIHPGGATPGPSHGPRHA
jgi:hypothetical protein